MSVLFYRFKSERRACNRPFQFEGSFISVASVKATISKKLKMDQIRLRVLDHKFDPFENGDDTMVRMGEQIFLERIGNVDNQRVLMGATPMPTCTSMLKLTLPPPSVMPTPISRSVSIYSWGARRMKHKRGDDGDNEYAYEQHARDGIASASALASEASPPPNFPPLLIDAVASEDNINLLELLTRPTFRERHDMGAMMAEVDTMMFGAACYEYNI